MTTLLGDFLRTRRGQLDPRTAGLPGGGIRRVPGLRREEVAVLAGVSSDYLARLEQGRETHPTAQVIDALARALNLDNHAGAHLLALAGLPAAPRAHTRRSFVHPELLQLLDAWTTTPAMVLDPLLNVLARNSLASALYAEFKRGDNLLQMTFLDPEGKRFYLDWDRAAQNAVANLRTAATTPSTELNELVAELDAGSAAFRRLWSQSEVRGKTHEPKRFHHHNVGELTLSYQAFTVSSAPEQQLIAYHAEPGSESADKLSLLRSLVVTPTSSGPRLEPQP